MVPNLMIGFGIDETQAEYVAEIRLRHLNREYILKRTEEIERAGKGHRRDGGSTLQSRRKIRSVIIIDELQAGHQKVRAAPAEPDLSIPPARRTRRPEEDDPATIRSTCSSPGRATLRRSPPSRCG